MKYIIINDKDSVGVALTDLAQGETAARTVLIDAVPQGHKFALADIRAGDRVLKYGNPIGAALRDIRAGEHVHTHNIRTDLKERVKYTYEPSYAGSGAAESGGKAAESTGEAAKFGSDAAESGIGICETSGGAISAIESGGASAEARYWMGYDRGGGSWGARNEIWIIPTVGCVNKTAEALAEIGRRRYKETYAFTHPYGCSQLGGDQLRTQRLLANLVMHPNAAGVLVLGLGCENNYIDEFKRVMAIYYNGCEKEFGGRIRFLNAQDCRDEFAEGAALLDGLAEAAEKCVRTRAPLSALRVGLKCGGSDGLSGVTANPLVGAVADKVIRAGGTAILTEVPEMFGAEHILMNRCADESLFGETVALINDFKDYYISHGQKIYENPSPGNKNGGISTLEDKSLGCTQKGGESPVTAVLRYGETVRAAGLNLLESPGNDLVAITCLTCAGAQIVLFTTGRGTPAGAPAPTMKISSNTRLAEAKPGWIDFDAGRLATGADFREMADELFGYTIALASGEAAAKNEANGCREIALFKDGVIL